MNNQIDPQEAHSLVAGKYINLIYFTNTVLQTEVSAVDEKSSILWEHATEGPAYSWGFL